MKTRLLLLSASASLVSGCFYGGDCDPEPDITVKLEAASEDVRSLPVLASGKLSLLGLNVPDAHGDVKVNLRMTNASSVDVTGLRFEEVVDGTPRTLEVLAQQHNGSTVNNGGSVVDKGQLRFAWRAKNLSELRLPAAKAHTGRVTLNWKYEGCRTQTGSATLDVPGFVKAVVSTGNLRLVSAEAAAPDLVKGAKVKMAVESAVGDAVVNLKDAKFTVTYFGDGLIPGVGLGLVQASQVALRSGGTARTQVAVGETLEVFTSQEPGASSPVFEPSGLAAAVGSISGGKALVTLNLTSEKQSQPGVPVVDTVTELVDLP
ncbi:hypothetical protein ATI61_10970 [Archangium gephyra]|uniref:Lipoprotein n=1 Tax=Archangium gephyra TaxID=48 RepID=A0AAC8Q2G2_9BACT|nr:hypothetical protein [Archangium gephyra]AKI99733.1 Hypothetical protein AA314_01360 [Archangium gephyra]REG27735.1 hypothetical protein ATI61_10970 [Archangium gephyra]